MQPTVYRQRFNPAGWIGAACFVAGPALIGWQLTEILRPSGFGEPTFGLLFLFSLLPALGVVLMLIGREYYDAGAEISAREDRVKEMQAKLKPASSAASQPSRS